MGVTQPTLAYCVNAKNNEMGKVPSDRSIDEGYHTNANVKEVYISEWNKGKAKSKGKSPGSKGGFDVPV